MPRKCNPATIYTPPKHRCRFCEAVNSRTVEVPAGKPCPVCGHYCTCEKQGCAMDCPYYGDLYNMDGDCIATK